MPGDFDMVGDSFGHTAADFHSPRVGVVIPVLNEERNIEECIRQTVMVSYCRCTCEVPTARPSFSRDLPIIFLGSFQITSRKTFILPVSF